MARVVIIISTFNGARYLSAQIESVLAQAGVDVTLWIRDDGSTDETRNLLAEYAADKRVQWFAGKNIGAADSFIDAVRLCDLQADYYSFCDQDDVWLADKLAVAVAEIRQMSPGPAMVCSTVTITDQDLTPRGRTAVPAKGPSFKNALVETVTCGNTIVMNPEAFSVVQTSLPQPGSIPMHDAWVYLLLSAVGEVRFYDRPGVLYRQHGQNVTGTGHSLARRMANRLQRLLVSSRHWDQARELKRFAHLLKADDLRALNRYVGYRRSGPLSVLRRVAFAARPSFVCQGWKADMYMRFLCLLGRA